MKFNMSTETITEVAKKVVVTMTQKKVTLVPDNYLIWFEYMTGVNKPLKADMDSIIASGGTFTDEVNEMLYNKHFNDGKEELVEIAHKETQKILKKIFDEILYTQSFTSDFRNKLETYTSELGSATELEQIQQVVSMIIKDTTEVAKSSEALQERLKETTVQTEKLKNQLEKVEREVLIDALTQINNRKALDKKLQELYNNYKRDGSPFCALMLDIDFFKKFNDQYGHLIGDEVLKIVAATLRSDLKGRDFAARYGGEEFAVLLPDTSLENSVKVAEQIRINISEKKFKAVKTGEKISQITISIGVAIINQEDSIESLFVRADEALYFAKESGRNIVKTEEDLKN